MNKTLLTYNDIHSLPEHSFASNGTIVDDKTVAIIKEIEKTLARLEAMGDDNVRCLWFRVAPGKPEDWDDYEDMKLWGDVENYDEYIALWKEHVNENTLWYRISVGYVNDFHYMLISDCEHRFWDIRSARYVSDKGDPSVFRHDYSEVMSKIKIAIEQCVEDILQDSGREYDEWVETNLPYQKRTGTIPRRLLNEYLGKTWLDDFNRPKLIGILEAESTPHEYDCMTLSQYMEMWVRCYRAVYADKYPDESVTEIFKRHNSKGYEAFEFDLDSEADFEKWHDENCGYHCFDVVYARVNLWPQKDEATGKWYFGICTHSYWNLGEYLMIAEKLYDAGIILKYHKTEIILPILKETDLVEITPGAYRYFQGDGIGSQIALWDIPDNIRDKVITATTWKTQPKMELAKAPLMGIPTIEE